MFGFLKDKLKQWVDKAKEKIGPAEAPEETIEESSEAKVSEPAVQKPKKFKKEKKPKKESPLEKTEKEEKLEKLEEKELVASDADVEVIREEAETVQEITEELEKGEISPKEAVKEIEELHEKVEEEILKPDEEKPKKGFFKKLFGKEEKGKKAGKEEGEEEEVIDIEEEEKAKKGFFELVKSTFTYKITEEDFNSLFDDLEMLLLENNVAVEAAEDIKRHLSKKLIGKEIPKNELEDEIKNELKNSLKEIMINPENPLELIKNKKKENEEPFVILFFGINGTGKTTSIAKVANLLKSKNISVVLAAADTFRAASIEQISEHAERLKVPLIKHNYGADPAAVGFDAIKYAQSHKIDVVLIDTAGRMHTKTNLISEMEKICRVTKPDLKLFVAESIAGNDATEQARTFHEAIGIDGSILSKADVDEKGGTIISVSHITHKPIFYLGTGQRYEDIKLFNKEDFIKSLGL